MKIERYGLQWTVQFSEKYNPDGNDIISVFGRRRVFLRQNGLVFAGRLYIHPFHGPYMDVRKVLNDNGIPYYILVPQYFFAEEFEEFVNTPWYRKLHDGYAFSKSAFKPYNSMYRMSLKTIGNNLEARIVAEMFSQFDFGKAVYIKGYKKELFVKEYFLFINKQTYEQLPYKWTIQDIYNMHKEYYDEQKHLRETLWNDIAKARANHEPIKIPVAYDSIFPVEIYSEKITKYGVKFPIILMDEENQKRIDEINRKYAKDSQRDNS